jgi:DNA-binding MarR family transcriptional regulator
MTVSELESDVAGEITIRDFGMLLGTASRLERIAAKEIERECGISHAMFEVLMRVGAADHTCPQTMGRLACDMILTSGGMTRLVDRMVKAGYVSRTPSPTDRRSQLVLLTEAGEHKLAEVKDVYSAALGRHFAGPLSAAQRDALRSALQVLDDKARLELGGLG